MIREANGNHPIQPSKRQRLSIDPYAYYAALQHPASAPAPAPAPAPAVGIRRPAAAAAAAATVASAVPSSDAPASAVAATVPPRPSNLDIKHSAVPPSELHIRLKMSVHDLERYGWRGARRRAAQSSVNMLARNALALRARALPPLVQAVADAATREVLRKERFPAIGAAAAAAASVADTEASPAKAEVVVDDNDEDPFRPMLEGKRLMEWLNDDGQWFTTTEHALALHRLRFPDDVLVYSPFFTCRSLPFDEQPAWLYGMQSTYGWCSSAGSAPVKMWSIRNASDYSDIAGVPLEVESLEDAYRAGWIVIAA